MDSGSNPFTTALLDLDQRALKDAFEHCNRQTDLVPYDRTTLGRWLAGTIPTRGEFVASLAERLDELSLYQAWLEARDSPTAAVKTVVTRFRGLDPIQKQQAYQRIRDELSRDVLGPVRSRYSMRVELHDGPDGLYRMRMAANWTGHLPADATVIIAATYDHLNQAFDESACVFRDLVELDPEELRRILISGDEAGQILSWSTADDRGRSSSCRGRPIDDGVFRFDNPELDRGRIMLRVTYPFPPGVQIYPIVFRGYHIAGPAEITLALRSRRAQNPRGYAFLGAGRRWRSSTWSDEVVIEAGSTRSLLGADTGIVLHWSERDSAPGAEESAWTGGQDGDVVRAIAGERSLPYVNESGSAQQWDQIVHRQS